VPAITGIGGPSIIAKIFAHLDPNSVVPAAVNLLSGPGKQSYLVKCCVVDDRCCLKTSQLGQLARVGYDTLTRRGTPLVWANGLDQWFGSTTARLVA